MEKLQGAERNCSTQFVDLVVGAGHFRKAQDILESIFGSKLAEIKEHNKRKELLAGQNDEVCEADDVNEDLETSPQNPRLSPTLYLE